MPETSQLWNRRYELVEEFKHRGANRSFLARDLALGRLVTIQLLAKRFRGFGPVGNEFAADARRTWELHDPVILRYLELHESESTPWLAREWIHGFSFLDLLRKRRTLSAEETVRLLDGIPAALDRWAAERKVPSALLERCFVHFESAEAVPLLATPVNQWLPFVPKLNLVNSPATTEDTDDTEDVTCLDAVAGFLEGITPAQAFAALWYELLGGRPELAIAGRYTPVSALEERTNLILRAVLLRESEWTCLRLWQELEAALPMKVSPQMHFPKAAGKPVAISISPSQMEDGMPKQIRLEGGPEPVRLVMREEFRFGRSLQHADFPIRFLPETRENTVRSSELSRVHVTATIESGNVVLRDGSSEHGPSKNGSRWNGERLSATEGRSISRRGVLAFGSHYEVEGYSVERDALDDCILSHPEGAELTWASRENQRIGAMFFVPRHDAKPVVNAIWLWTSAGFGIAPHGEVAWDLDGSQPAPAAFVWRRGKLWLLNRTLADASIRIDESAVLPGTMARLHPSQKLCLGETEYVVTSEESHT